MTKQAGERERERAGEDHKTNLGTTDGRPRRMRLRCGGGDSQGEILVYGFRERETYGLIARILVSRSVMNDTNCHRSSLNTRRERRTTFLNGHGGIGRFLKLSPKWIDLTYMGFRCS